LELAFLLSAVAATGRLLLWGGFALVIHTEIYDQQAQKFDE